MKSEKYPLSQSELGVFLACEKPTLAYNLPFLWELPESWDEEKLKDYEPFNSMLRLVKMFDGLRIYKVD